MRLLLLLLLLIIIGFLFRSRCDRFETFRYLSNTPGPNILFVAGTHGNEPAGSVAMHELIQRFKNGDIKCKSGSITIIPEANPCGLKLGVRYQPQNLLTFGMAGGIDLNRAYHSEEAKCEVAGKIGGLVREADWVFDMHEGWGFHKLDENSMGSGVYFGKTAGSERIAKEITKSLNKNIPEEGKQFVCLEWEALPGSLRDLSDSLEKRYILVETSGQNDIQPLEVRAGQHLFLALEFLKRLQVV